MDALANDWRVSLPFFAAIGAAFGIMLCAYARVLMQLKLKRVFLFRLYGVYESVWTLLTVCALVACIAIFMGVDFTGRMLRDPNSLYTLLPFVVAIASAVLSIYAITKVFPFHPR